MIIIPFIHKSKLFFVSTIVFALALSCGSYEYVGIYEDAIYGDSNATKYNSNYENDVAENDEGNSYYNDYFKGKASEYSTDKNTVFTNADDYSGDYTTNNNQSETSYAGWGQNSDSNVVINIQSNPYIGMGWGWNNMGWNRWGRNRWGWNAGWNNWGWNNWGWNAGWNWGYPSYGFWDPFFINNYYWNNPYWYGYNIPYRGRNVAYVNGNRSNSYRNSSNRFNSLSNRSALSTVSRVRTNNASATRSTSRSYTTSRPTRTTTTTTVRNNNNGTVRTTRSSRTITQPSSTTRSTRSTTIINTRLTPRSTPSMRSSGSSSRSGGMSTRSRRN